MKKLFSLLFVLTFAVILAACGPNDGDTTTTGTTGTTDTTGTTGTTLPDQEPDDEDVVVTFAAFGTGTAEENNLLRRRVRAFNEKDNGIFIEIMDREGNWDEWLQTQASAGNIPDIMQLNSVSTGIMKGWLADITDIALADDEWDNIPTALVDSITYFDRAYAVPAAYNYLGFLANIDLIETQSGSTADFEGLDYTFDEFETAIRGLRDVNVSDGTGTIGAVNAVEFITWLPAVLDETNSLGYYTWNNVTSGFDFGAPYFTSLSRARELADGGYMHASYSNAGTGEDGEGPSEMETIFGTNNGNHAFQAGQVGFTWGASYSYKTHFNAVDGQYNLEFVALPGNKVVGGSDYFGISRAASDKEAAYEAAKYLTFGLEGINDAFDIIDNALEDEEIQLEMSGLPLNDDLDIVNRWFDTYLIDGFRTAYDKVQDGEIEVLVSANKWAPEFSYIRFNFPTGLEANKISRPTAADGVELTINQYMWDYQLGLISQDPSSHIDQQLVNAMVNHYIEAEDIIRLIVELNQ